jgi:hypothetical protein
MASGLRARTSGRRRQACPDPDRPPQGVSLAFQAARASRPAGNAGCVSSAPHLVFKTGGAFNEGYFTAARREWGQDFGYEVLTTAILDRLLHHCEVVPINDNSYRLKNRLRPSNGTPTWPE